MRLIILGAGGFGRTVADVARQLGYEIEFLDDSFPECSLISFTSYIDDDTAFIPAFGNNNLRMEWLEKIEKAGGKLATLIHPTAYVSPTAKIAEGVVVLPHAIVNTEVAVGKGCIVNLGCMVDHGCVVEEGVHLCLGCIIKAENKISRLMKIEAGAVIEARSLPL